MTADQKKAAFHAFLVVAALIEYRSTDKPFRKQLCGAWAGFHIVSVVLDLASDGEVTESRSLARGQAAGR